MIRGVSGHETIWGQDNGIITEITDRNRGTAYLFLKNYLCYLFINVIILLVSSNLLLERDRAKPCCF
jgi:hypothetical protein